MNLLILNLLLWITWIHNTYIFHSVENIYINHFENHVEKFSVLKMFTLTMLKTVLKVFMQGKSEYYIPFFQSDFTQFSGTIHMYI